MLNKIDPQLLNQVKTQSVHNDLVDCIVYANDYYRTKQSLQTLLKQGAIYEYPFILAFGVRVNFDGLTKLAGLEQISYITGNFKVTTLVAVSKKVLHLNNVGISYQKKIPFTVAVIDTGMEPVLDFMVPQKRLVEFVDFVHHKREPYDDNGHGTFVSSVLGGNGLVSGGHYAGIFPQAFFVSLKALDEEGETGAMTILEAMQWVYDHRKKYNIKVVCMSFGSAPIGKRDPLIIGAEVLWNAGVCVVSAAGNSGPEEETIKSPGASNKIITVGALDDHRVGEEVNPEQYDIADFSSRGPVFGNYKPDVVAPGVNITGAGNFRLTHQHYKVMSGTSVATPMVAGVCGLLYQVNPHLAPNEIKRMLLSHSIPIINDKNAEGYGLVNADFLQHFKIY